MIECPYCGLSITAEQDFVICPGCTTIYHSECWEANARRCSVRGCSGSGDLPIQNLRSGQVPEPEQQRIRVLAFWFENNTRREWPLDASLADTLQDLEKCLQEELRREGIHPPGLLICCESADPDKTLEALGKTDGSEVRFVYKSTKPDMITILATWQDKQGAQVLPISVPPDCTKEFLEGELLREVKSSSKYKKRYKNPKFFAALHGGTKKSLMSLGIKDGARVWFDLETDQPHLLVRLWDWFREHHARIETIVEVALFAIVILQLREITNQNRVALDIADALKEHVVEVRKAVSVAQGTLEYIRGTLSPLNVASTEDGQVKVTNGGSSLLFLNRAYITTPSGDRVPLITQNGEFEITLRAGESALLNIQSELPVLREIFGQKVTLTIEFRYSGHDLVARWDCRVFPTTKEDKLRMRVDVLPQR